MSLSSQATAEFGQSSSTNEPKVQPKQYFGNRMEYVEYGLDASGLTLTDVDFYKTVLINQTAEATLTLPPAAVSAGGWLHIIFKTQADVSVLIGSSSGESMNTSLVYAGGPTRVLNSTGAPFFLYGSSAGAGASQLYLFCDGIAWYLRGATTELTAT